MAGLSDEEVRRLLCRLGDHVRDAVLGARDAAGPASGLASVVGRTAADTMYGLDRISDEALLAWFEHEWPSDEPVEVVTEALDAPVIVPASAPASTLRWTCIVDPVDGTRGLMYDKRAAWVLAGAARRDPARPARLSDLVAAAMTEIPVTKQWGADQVSGVRGCGPAGLVAERVDVRNGTRAPIVVRPSAATDLEHGWAGMAKFFPQGKAVTAAFEERLWAALHPGRGADVAIFDDQYLATGGQFHELLAGHDRLLGDLRPLVAAQAGERPATACHPYDCCTVLLLGEAGCVVTSPWGGALDAPLDTTTPVAWVGYANPRLAALAAPVLERLVREQFPAAAPPAR